MVTYELKYLWIDPRKVLKKKKIKEEDNIETGFKFSVITTCHF